MAIVLFLTCLQGFAQKFPDRIRGYKVYDKPVSHESKGPATDPAANVELGQPEIVVISAAGVTFEVNVEVKPLGQKGKVDFLSFHDFQVNGLPIAIEEYKIPFLIHADRPTILPEPTRFTMPAAGIVRTAWNELRDSKDEWTIKGRVLVFGRFRKMGFSFKRVVPVDVEFKIRNPLKAG
jgi:hypothetical protein